MSDFSESVTTASKSSGVNFRSASVEKVALFRSLFRGREDVYPRRFVGKTSGSAGYASVCGNEWVRGICEKPRIKCGDCPRRAFLPMNEEVIRWHLSGKDKVGQDFVAGIYPMLADETCYFLAMDFDKETWSDDVLAVMSGYFSKIRFLPRSLVSWFIYSNGNDGASA